MLSSELNKSGSSVSTPNSLRSFLIPWSISEELNTSSENDFSSSADEEKSFSEEVFNSSEIDQGIRNDLKEFGVDTDEPDLFNSDDNNPSPDNLLGISEEDNEEDDLEIPAFLRRQKN